MKKIYHNLLAYSLRSISRATLWRFKPTIVGITGSAGKTSAREAIWVVLNNEANVRRSRGNFNTEFGLPLTILGDYKKIWRPLIVFWKIVIIKGFLSLLRHKSSYPKTLILEYGADKQGDIAKLVRIAKPNIGVITSVGDFPVHMEFYQNSAESVAKEKAKLISALSVSDTAVINFDDKYADFLKSKTRAKIIGFGFSDDSDIKISNFSHMVENGKIKGIRFKLESDNSMVPISISGVFSIGHAYSAAVAACVSGEFNINIVNAANILSNKYMVENGRSNILAGIKNTQIIDESYNSSPIAMKLAIETFSSVDFARRVGVIGDMLELGEATQKIHEMIGKVAYEAFDVLITVGDRAKFIAKTAKKNSKRNIDIFEFDTSDDAVKKIKSIIKKDDIILIKGSRAIGLEKIVNILKKI